MARKIVGIVTSDVQDKTIVVSVARRVTHPIYGKQYTVTKKFAAHDEENKAHAGDKVEVIETRPISKHKTWKLNQILETAPEKIVLKPEVQSVEAPKAAKAPAKADKPTPEDKEAA